MIVAYIGLGSNLDQPERQVLEAMAELEQLPDTCQVKKSSLYRSAPVGPQDQPDFINAVVQLETELSAQSLLEQLQQLEHKHGRVRTQHWGPRTLDLDLLLYGNMIIKTEKLTVPHPHMAARSFVLYPLLEIAPELAIPELGRVSELYQCVQMQPPARVVLS